MEGLADCESLAGGIFQVPHILLLERQSRQVARCLRQPCLTSRRRTRAAVDRNMAIKMFTPGCSFIGDTTWHILR